VAYQGYARAILPVDEVRELNRIATGGLGPDLTLLLDVDVADGLEQARAKGVDRLEMEGLEFHQRVREGYLAIAAQEPERFRIVPRGPVAVVAAAVWSHVEALLAESGRV
jgi:dTMP kinase